jgi:hypothetical protein
MGLVAHADSWMGASGRGRVQEEKRILTITKTWEKFMRGMFIKGRGEKQRFRTSPATILSSAAHSLSRGRGIIGLLKRFSRSPQ